MSSQAETCQTSWRLNCVKGGSEPSEHLQQLLIDLGKISEQWSSPGHCSTQPVTHAFQLDADAKCVAAID